MENPKRVRISVPKNEYRTLRNLISFQLLVFNRGYEDS